MVFLRKTGIGLFIFALVNFVFSLSLSQFRMTDAVVEAQIAKPYHRDIIIGKALEMRVLDERYATNFEFIGHLSEVLQAAQTQLETDAQIVDGKATNLPEGVAEWNFRMSDGDLKSYKLLLTKHASKGLLPTNIRLFFWLTIGLGIFGALLCLLPQFRELPGIKNNDIFHHPATKGVRGGWLGIVIGLFLIAFYVVLYWAPEYLTNWILLVEPISLFLSGKEASQWFLYGFLYTVVMLVMGVRMVAKYQRNRYQLIRTGSVLFFQTAFAFLIPEILVRLNQPYFDFKNMWPLDYDFFFEWNLSTLLQSGNLGVFMLVWGIVLFVVGVPVLTYFFGKRWYCSWVCGCGGLAETLGDPWRQLSDKSLRAWRVERYLVHSVLVFSIVMTALVLYTYFTGKSEVFGLNSYSVRSWYGFLIGATFAGVVGTGFYPLMGNRVWCRFGCPLAAYLGIVQRLKSRFRITTNGGQCISCGNCSTYCEMGIDVRWYAQRGQDIVRASCVGCGVCSAVCPRGVLRLENAAADVLERAVSSRAVLISKNGVKLLP